MYLGLSQTKDKIEVLCSLSIHLGGLAKGGKVGTRDVLVKQGKTPDLKSTPGRPSNDKKEDVMLSVLLLPHFANWVSTPWFMSLNLVPRSMAKSKVSARRGFTFEHTSF